MAMTKNDPHYVLAIKTGQLSAYSSRRAAIRGARRAAVRDGAETYVLADAPTEWEIWEGYDPTGSEYDSAALGRKIGKVGRALERLG